MIVKFFCTKCGTQIESDDSRDFVFCTRCGSRETVKRPAAAQPAAQPAAQAAARPAGQPNLIVSYSSINPGVNMILDVMSINMRYFFQSGMSMPFTLPAGQHILILQIGRKRYKRSVYLTANGLPVTVNSAWDGRARINIDQPFINAGYPSAPPQYYAPQQQYPAQQYPTQQYPAQQPPVVQASPQYPARAPQIVQPNPMPQQQSLPLQPQYPSTPPSESATGPLSPESAPDQATVLIQPENYQ